MSSPTLSPLEPALAASASLHVFAELCRQLAATTKKLEKRAQMAAYLAALPAEDASRAALYLAGTPFAETDTRRLQVGGSTLGKAVAQLAEVGPEALATAYRLRGDLGDAAFDLLSARSWSPQGSALLLSDLEATCTLLAASRGPATKLRLIAELLGRADALEARYVIKLMSGDMRTGVKQSLVEEAIAAAYGVDASGVRRAVMLNGDLAAVVAMAAARTLDQARMRLFHPLGFMLASPVDSVEAALARFAEEVALEAAGIEGAAGVETLDSASPLPTTAVTQIVQSGAPGLRAAQVEDKYDGMRAQLHCGDRSQPGRVGLFSRNREDLAESFPELIEAFAGFGEAVILDGEILAWQPGFSLPADPEQSEGPALDVALVDRSGGRALPFSALQQRLGRKRVPQSIRERTPVVFMAFDLLYQGGELLLERPLAERRARLEALAATHGATTTDAPLLTQSTLFGAPEQPGLPRLLLAPAVRLADAAQLDAAYLDARARGNEGVMIKTLASAYQPGRRGLAWLKLKRELATLDVVITGAEFGNGRRAGVLSDYTFAVRRPVDPGPGSGRGSGDEPSERQGNLLGDLLNVGKAYSGLTDVEVDALSKRLHDQTLEDYGHSRTVEPTIVLEVAFNNIMRSERHASGFALRFPRILRIREDKPVDEIDTLARVEEIYASQPDKPAES